MYVGWVEGKMARFEQSERGITVVEILVTLAIASVLIGLALPAFNGMMAQRALRSEANEFILSVQLARSEAARRGTNVSVQARDASDDANEWGAQGWCVVLGDGGACPGNVNELQTFPTPGTNTFDGKNDVDTLTFNPRGLLVAGVEQQLMLCDPDETTDPGRLFRVSLVGRVSADIDSDCVFP
jgi:type IV fimbrial biogenesis protein FimT